jgi:alanyl-tRNA synthetase
MRGAEIRESFLRFFEERGHKRVPSSSLIPPPESGLLLTNAGMNQFIPYFLGHAPAPFPRAVTVQKCFRALDIDNVGHTARHLTFFEMLGNFSFGDYFKRDSCAWGYELVTDVWGLSPDRLWVTVFETDDEAQEIWQDIGVPSERIVRRGVADNYWWTHAAGPAGPCSEIYVDRGARYGPEGGPEVDEERYVEIWNHVFMQDEVDDEMRFVGELPDKNIDTGSSLERVAMVLQDKDNIFETDLMRPLLDVVESVSGLQHGKEERTDVSLKVVAEHGRATTFLIADGVLPSNEGRGYVLRRMLRRVVSHARRLGLERDVMPSLVGATVERFGDAYPELIENRAYVEQVAASEEERFAGTLRQGMTLFDSEVARTPGRVSGDVVFKLHDTFGFPRELTAELASEAGLELDDARFDELMAQQRERAQAAVRQERAGEDLAGVAAESGRTEFVGYQALQGDGRVVAVLGERGRVEVAGDGDDVRVILNRTPFYAEQGGQIGDHGYLRTPTGIVRVVDTRFGPGDVIVHSGVVQSGEVRAGDDVHAEVDEVRREATARAHSATHIVHWTLRHVLGEHARQAGSLVAPGRLRFDFPHHSAVPSDLLDQAEELANTRVAEDATVKIYETTLEEAKNEGALALFGEKYGDFVRVAEIGDYSIELCAGTHVVHTGNIGLIRVAGEGSIGAGVRRVEAIVGPDALREINADRALFDDVLEALQIGDRQAAPERIRAILDQNRRLRAELAAVRKRDVADRAQGIASEAIDVDGARLVTRREDLAADELRGLAADAAGRLEGPGGAVVVLGSAVGGRALLVAASTPNVVARGAPAPALLAPAAAAIGGGAGGKPTLGTAGGPKGEAVDEALGLVAVRLEELLTGG